MSESRYLLLCGGVGGSRMAAGFAAVLPPERLAIVVNTADDFDHFGLRICPDIDTVTYMLGGHVDETRGWGRRDESWRMMAAMGALGGETWFNLGDQDLALHLRRTELLKQGLTLSQVTTALARKLGVAHPLVPMSDAPVRTIVRTADAELPFQEYFVHRRCEPVATAVLYDGADAAAPAPAFAAALADPDLRGIILAPSNPVLSIAPILAVAGVRDALLARKVPVVAVTPLIAGKAVKGPAAKIMTELGFAAGVDGVAACYDGLIDGLIIDERDGRAGTRIGDVRLFATDTLMPDAESRARVARCCLEAIATLRH